MGSSGSFGLVVFISARPGGRFFKFGRGLGVVGFIPVRWVHSGAPRRLDGLIRARPRGRWVHSVRRRCR